MSIFENFALKKSESVSEEIKKHFNDFNNLDRLILHRDMFHDYFENKNANISYLDDIIEQFKQHPDLINLVEEFSKYIKILAVVPTNSCTAERSFSALRRLKTFLRSTIGQSRLNDVAIIHIHKEIAEKIDLDEIANQFILVNNLRKNTFSTVIAN